MSLLPPIQATDNNGNPVAGAKRKFYASGTTTPVAVYSDEDCTVSLGSTLTADASGWFPPCYLKDSISYRVRLETSAGALIGQNDVDPWNAATVIDSGSASFNPEETYPAGTVGNALVDGQHALTSNDPTLENWFTVSRDGSTATFKFRGPFGVIYTGTMSLVGDEDAVLFKRQIYGFNDNAAVSTVRFPSILPITSTSGLIAYSARTAAVNDNENGMRLEVKSYTINYDTKSITFGAATVIYTPAGFSAGEGGCYCSGLVRLSNGRILLIANNLHDENGLTTDVPSAYDVCAFYSDDNGATWSAKQSILPATDAYTGFGLTAANASAGLNIPGGANSVTYLSSGRVVVTGYIINASGNIFIGSIYTDSSTGLTGWQCGTTTQYPSSNYNEPSVSVLPDGTLMAFVRREDAVGRGVYTSANSGETWIFSRFDTTTAIRNVAGPSMYDDGTLMVGGACNVSDNRQDWKLFPSSDNGASFNAGVSRIFSPKQRIGYGQLVRLKAGYWGLVYEATATQAGLSFNQKGSIGMAVFNPSILVADPPASRAHDSTLYNAASEYAAYESYVTGDGGTIVDATACQSAIAAAIAGNYYSGMGAAIGYKWGRKAIGASGHKLYSLNRIATSNAYVEDGYSGEWIYDSSGKLQFVNSSVYFVFKSIILRKGSTYGFVLNDAATNTNASNSLAWRWTQSGQLNQAQAGGQMLYINGAVTPVCSGSPNFTAGYTDVSHFILDCDERVIFAGKNGADDQAPQNFNLVSAVNDTVDLKLMNVGGANRLLTEAWFFNDATPAAIRQCSADVKARI